MGDASTVLAKLTAIVEGGPSKLAMTVSTTVLGSLVMLEGLGGMWGDV